MTTEQQTTFIDPAKLAPDFDTIDGELQSSEHTFWLGLTADCPRGQIDVAGLHFPKHVESIEKNNAGEQVRVPVVGTINFTVSRRNFDALAAVLPRLVIRFDKQVDEERGTGKNVGAPVKRATGRLIKIPTQKQFADALEHGRELRPYVKRPGDRPASEFMYFMHAPDGVRGHEYRTIAEVGLEWPEVLELNELLS